MEETMAARALAMFLVLMLPLVGAQWPSFHNDARNAGVETSVPYSLIEEVWWTIPAVADMKVQASPVHDDGVLVVAYTPFKDGPGKGLVRGIDAVSGKVRWDHESPAGVVGTPAIALGRVYYADKAGNLVGLDLDSGEQVDSTKFGAGSLGPITYHEGKIFFGTEAGTVLSYSLEPKLDKLWTFKVTDVFRNSDLNAQNETICPTTAGNRHEAGPIRSAPAVHEGFVFFGSMNHHVYAVREAGEPDGTTPVMWSYKTQDIIQGSPAVDHVRGHVIIGSYDERVYAFDARPAASGSNICYGHKALPVWTFTVPSGIGDSKVHSTPAIADAKVVFGANNGRVYGLHASTGAKLWEAETNGPVLSSPAIAGKLAVVGSDGRKIHWINIDNGSLGLEFDTAAPIKTSPALDGTDALIVTDAGTIMRMGAKAPPRADLRVASIFTDELGFVITIENIGRANSTATTARVSWTQDVTVAVPPIAVNQSVEVFVDAELTGSVVVQVTVDPDDKIWELDETKNNVLEDATFIAPPPEPPAPVNTTVPNATEESSLGRWITIGGIALAVIGLGVGGMLWYNRRQLEEEEEEEEEEDEY